MTPREPVPTSRPSPVCYEHDAIQTSHGTDQTSGVGVELRGLLLGFLELLDDDPLRSNATGASHGRDLLAESFVLRRVVGRFASGWVFFEGCRYT